jgi:hypothetical protein
MKEISAPPFGFFNRRGLLAFALCSVGVLLAMLSFAANPPRGMRGTSGSSTGGSLFVDNPTGPRWSIVKSPNNGSPGTNHFFATTCASASDCWAVGYYAIGGGVFQTLIEQWDGNFWTIVSSPNPSGAQDSELLGVTCASLAQCWAAGHYASTGPPQTLVERWQGAVMFQ